MQTLAPQIVKTTVEDAVTRNGDVGVLLTLDTVHYGFTGTLDQKLAAKLASQLTPEVFVAIHTAVNAFPLPNLTANAAQLEAIARLHRVADRLKELLS